MNRILLAIAMGVTWADRVAAAEVEDSAFFESKIRPILVARCYECHSAAKKQQGGLRLDTRDGWRTGGDSGPAVVAGDPDKSLLIERILGEEAGAIMPPKNAGKPLTAQQIADLVT